MSRTLSVDLGTHIHDATTTSLATCWKITRTDGETRTFTDHDLPLVIDADGGGELSYEPNLSFSRSETVNTDKMTLDVLELDGILDDSQLSQEDLLAGMYDQAELRIFFVNWQDLTQGVMKELRGWFGEVALGDYGYKVEVHSLKSAYTEAIVELLQGKCRAGFGSQTGGLRGGCLLKKHPDKRLDLQAYVVGDIVELAVFDGRRYRATTSGTTDSGEPTFDTTVGATTGDGSVVWETLNSLYKLGIVSAVTDRRQFTVEGILGPVDVGAGGSETLSYFALGQVLFLDGSNVGSPREISTNGALAGSPDAVTVTLYLPAVFDVALGTSVELQTGCDHTTGVCFGNYDNMDNYRGWPYLPGEDFLLKVYKPKDE